MCSTTASFEPARTIPAGNRDVGSVGSGGLVMPKPTRGLRSQRNRPRSARLALASAILAVVTIPLAGYSYLAPPVRPAIAQSAQAAAFEVTSVKPCNEGMGPRGRGGAAGDTQTSSPGRLVLPCQPLRNLIRIAYVRAYFRATGDALQMEGGPSWMDARSYQIIAKAERPVPIADMEGPMLQQLLIERFHLRTHRESRETSVFALSVATGGLKIRPSTPGACIVRDPDDAEPAAPPAGAKPYCGDVTMGMGPYRLTYTVAAGTLHQLALNLGGHLDRPVLDRTGVGGTFDLHLEFAPFRADPADARTAPSIFAALAAIGLRLEATQGPRDVLVIDHVEAPTAN